MARTFFKWQYLQLLTLAIIHEHFDFSVSLDLFFNRVNHYFMSHSLALYRRVWLTKKNSGIHNCISLDISRTRDWLLTLIANNALYIVNIYSVFFSLSCFVMYNCKYLQRQFFLARKVLIPCKYETNVWSIYKFYIKKLPETQCCSSCSKHYIFSVAGNYMAK